ncbi:MAG: DUF5063 domain-containing protein [Leptospiraceae bacterium]|nr:DUF5063 domain-containing protein [Leptospiraceae bacterium]
MHPFVKTAKSFCKIIEKNQDYKPRAFKMILYKSILQLLYHVAKLSDEDIYSVSKYDLDASTIFSELKEIFSTKNFYKEIYNPYDFNDIEPVIGSLADDLTDIYKELKPGLIKWKKVNKKKKRKILSTWKFTFKIHWGEHATGAVRALYYQLYTKQ